MLAVMDGEIASAEALAVSDAYQAERLPKLREARTTVAELIEAAKDAMDCDTIRAWGAVKGERRQELLAGYECAPGMRPVHETKTRLRAALARVQGGQS